MEKYQTAIIHDAAGDLAARWYVEYKFRDPDSNKFTKHREWISSRITTRTGRYTKAAELRKAINQRLASGWSPYDPVSRSKSTGAAMLEVLNIKAATCGKRAKSSYGSIGTMFLDWLEMHSLKALRPEQITRSIAQKFLDHLLLEKQLANRTYNNYLVALRTLFETMVAREYLESNVWRKLPKLRVKEADISCFSQAERTIISERLPVDHPQLYLVAKVIFYCFLRPAEIVRLQVHDVDLRREIIRVPASKSKNGRSQVVVMPPDLVQSFIAGGIGELHHDLYIFANYRTLTPGIKPTAPTRISEAWKAIVKEKYGINRDIYEFKHTGAGEAFEAGELDARNIQMQMRHHSLEETQNYLTRFTNRPSDAFRTKMPAF